MKKTEGKKVCHISTVHLPNDVRILYRECGSLVKAGYDVHLIIDVDQDKVLDGVHLHKLKKPASRLLRMLISPWRAMFKALKINPDIYHYHDPEFIFAGFILKWIFNKKVVYDVHESVTKQILGKTYIPPFARKVISMSYRFVEVVFTAGQAIIVANAKSVEEHRKKPYLVQNYPLLDEKLLTSISEKGKLAEIPTLVFVGRISESRGADAYVELAGKLDERGRDFRMKLIGMALDGSVERLEARVKEMNLQDKVSFMGRIEWKQAMREASEGTIGLCLFMPIPNNLILLSTKIIEYMMLGVPVIASNFDTWRSYVQGERIGMMVDPTNIEEVADVCEKMLSDRNELIAMGKRGVEAVRARYNWESEFEVQLQCYDDLLRK